MPWGISGFWRFENHSRNANIGSQVSNFSFFHLRDYSFGLLSRFDHLQSLFLGNIRLAFRNIRLAKKNNELKSADDHQQKAKCPNAQINLVSLDRYFQGLPENSYALIFFILILWFVAIWALGSGLYRVIYLRSRVGWLLVFLSLMLNAVACVSGAVGCLPWNWRRCLDGNQTDSQNQGFHIQAALCQKIGSIPSSCVS